MEEEPRKERRRDPLRRFWMRDAMRELADAGEIEPIEPIEQPGEDTEQAPADTDAPAGSQPT